MILFTIFAIFLAKKASEKKESIMASKTPEQDWTKLCKEFRKIQSEQISLPLFSNGTLQKNRLPEFQELEKKAEALKEKMRQFLTENT